MSILEIIISIFLLVILPAFAIKLSFNAVKKIKEIREKRKSIISQINLKVKQGLNSINGTTMSVAEIKKMVIKKSKFIVKVDKIINIISQCSSVPVRNFEMRDGLAEVFCSVRVLSSEDPRLKPYVVDYTFLNNILTELITNTKFPPKDDYLRLNELYKKYKQVQKEMKNEKLQNRI